MTLRGLDSYTAWRFHIYGCPKRTSETSSGETSHITSSLKGLMSYGRRHCWLTRMSHPGVSHPMLYGCGCGNVGRFSRLTTSTKIRFFWLPLSTMKCNGFPCTHICEWKSRSPSYVSSGSSGWIFVVAMVMLGSTSMIFLP